MTGRFVSSALIVSLAVLVGLGLWLRFLYEETPGPHEISVISRGSGAVGFELEVLPGLQLDRRDIGASSGWVVDGNRLRAVEPGERATYAGPVHDHVTIHWETGPEAGVAELLVDGVSWGTRSLRATETATERQLLTFTPSLRPQSFLALALLIVAAAPFVRWIGRRLEEWVPARPRAVGATVLGALALAHLAVVVWPIHPPAVAEYRLAVDALGRSAPGSAGDEIWIQIVRTSGVPVPAEQLVAGDEGWEARPPWALSATGDSDELRWRGLASPGDVIDFRQYEWSGKARLPVNGRSRIVDTFAGPRRLTLGELSGPPSGPSAVLRVTTWVTDRLLLATAMLAGAVAFATPRRPASPLDPTVDAVTARERWRLTLALAAIPFLGWMLLLVLFWPGMVSPDTVMQWRQLDVTGLDDWHPYVLAVLMGLSRRVIDSPAPLLVLIIAVGSVVIGRFGAWMVWRGRSLRSTVLTLALVVVLPSVSLVTIVLWKDAVYGLAVLGVMLIIWRVEDTEGAWLGSPRNVALLVGTCLVVWLSRHNGLPVVGGTLLVLGLAFRRHWRAVAAAAVATVSIAFIVEVPLARVLGVEPQRQAGMVVIQRLANHVERGTPLDERDRRVLAAVRPLDEPWPYDCHTFQPTWAGPDRFTPDEYAGDEWALAATAVRLALRAPGAELDHLACSTSILWRPTTPPHSTTYLLEWRERGGEVDYSPWSFSAVPPQDPPAPRALRRLFHLVDTTLPDWVIRPALYLYALCAGAVVAWYRRRHPAPLRIVAPALIHTLVLLPVTLGPDVRFQYPVILAAALMVPPLLTVSRRRDGEPALTWQREDRTEDQRAQRPSARSVAEV